MAKKILNKFWLWIKPYINRRMLPIMISVWVFTNFIWYFIALVKIGFIPSWLSTFAKAYIAFLWLPFSAEKPIIIAISMIIYKIIYKEKFVKKKEEIC